MASSAPTGTVPARPSAGVLRAQRATYVAFISSGFGFASWASRIPSVRDSLQASPSTLGLVLLCVALGSLVALPSAGLLVTRFGTARAVAAMSFCLALGLVVVGVGYSYGVWPVAAGLVLFGFGNGIWDVAMNVEGAAVEQGLGRAVLPRFHAGWSVGTVTGALGGAAMVGLGVPVTAHLVVAALLLAVVVPLAALRGFLPDPGPEPGRSDDEHRHSPLQAWREPRTLLIGLFVLCMAFTEGTGNDWLAVAVLDGYGAPPVAGPLTFAAFLAAMTCARWSGPQLIARYGRVRALRTSALVALVGLLLVVFGTVLPLAVAGAVLLGLGAALGFPVGMSAAADDPARAAGRVSVVASIGYTAFLAGPPLIGFLGDHVGVLRALVVTAVLLSAAVLLAGRTAPLTDGPRRLPSRSPAQPGT